MDNILNFDQMNDELTNYLNNLITKSKTNQHYEKPHEPIDYSKYVLSNYSMQEKFTKSDYTAMCGRQAF